MSRTAVISVYNKEGIVDFAKELVGMGWNIISSGGTAKTIAAAGVPVRDVAELSGMKAILDHRVVTLVPQVHGGLLAKDTEEHRADLKKINAERIDLVCVDMYPLEKTIADPKSTFDEVIEMIDIGGPTQLKSGAKGLRIVICDPKDRQRVIDWLKAGEPDRDAFVRELAAKAFYVVSRYYALAAEYIGKGRYATMFGELVDECAYGENAWQTPACHYKTTGDDALALHTFRVISGSSLSYNNKCDIDRLLQSMTHVADACLFNVSDCMPFIGVVMKHGNACGAKVSFKSVSAVTDTVLGDTRAAFGGLVMFNFHITKELAELMVTAGMPEDKTQKFDGVIAPSFDADAVGVLERKGGKCRVIVNPALGNLVLDRVKRFRYVRGGFLTQPNYTYVLDFNDPEVEVIGELDDETKRDLSLAWAIGSTSTSNTITDVNNSMMLGNGVGQQDRVGAAELVIKRARDAGHATDGSCAYSDSFFPFNDGPEVLIRNGIRAILASSGSVNDAKLKELCKNRGITLVLVPDKKGRGFYGH